MKTSLNKLQEIEAFLTGNGDAGDALVFEARTIVDPQLLNEVTLQQNAYVMITQYGRLKLKAELNIVHQQLFTQKRYQRFSQKIMALFN